MITLWFHDFSYSLHKFTNLFTINIPYSNFSRPLTIIIISAE